MLKKCQRFLVFSSWFSGCIMLFGSSWPHDLVYYHFFLTEDVMISTFHGLMLGIRSAVGCVFTSFNIANKNVIFEMTELLNVTI